MLKLISSFVYMIYIIDCNAYIEYKEDKINWHFLYTAQIDKENESDQLVSIFSSKNYNVFRIVVLMSLF